MAKEEKNIIISITSGTIVRAILFGLLLWMIYILRDIALIILTSVVIASAIEPVARFFEKYRIPRVWGVVLVYLIIVVMLGSIFYFILPPLFSDLSGISTLIPEYLEDPFKSPTFSSLASNLPGKLSAILSDFAGLIKSVISNLTSGIFGGVSAIFGGAMSLVLITILSFYLTVQKDGVENFLRVITPVDKEEYIVGLWRRTQRKIGLWMQGQILLGVLIGVLVYLGLTILQIKYALAFALLAALFELIPVFGPVMAAIPAIAIAFLQSGTTGLLVLALYVIIQQFENHLIYPLVVKKIVGVPPLLVILSLLIGASLAGFFGVILSIPVAAALMEFTSDIAKKKHIFDPKKSKDDEE